MLIKDNLLLLLGGAFLMSNLFLKWKLPERAKPYKLEIDNAAKRAGIPALLLGRVLWQESRFRPEIIDGSLKSNAGAVGIAQIVPKWHPNVNPYNPVESIHYAAQYLKKLHYRFGKWSHALAAYNWGQGNLSQYLRGEKKSMPLETQNYVKEIISDIF